MCCVWESGRQALRGWLSGKGRAGAEQDVRRGQGVEESEEIRGGQKGAWSARSRAGVRVRVRVPRDNVGPMVAWGLATRQAQTKGRRSGAGWAGGLGGDGENDN